MSWAEWAGEVEIEPSIYASDFSRLGEQLGAVQAAGARVFHFDVGDGHFIPEITIGPIVAASISPLVRGWGARLDCHLMVSEPEKHFEAIAKAGGDSVTFHVEACDEPARAIARARDARAGSGRRLQPRDARSRTRSPPREGADLVLCMSIHPGYSGQAFMPDAFDRIARLRELLPADVRVQVDGGVNRETARRCPRRGRRPTRRRQRDLLEATIRRRPIVSSSTSSRRARVPEELLEIRDADAAFERIEEWLSARGFFAPGGEELVADVYLGYGLSQAIRRSTAQAPPEPCPALPFAACRAVAEESLATDWYKASAAIGDWEQTWTASEYRAAIDEVRDAIARGDVYQVNLVQHLQAPFAGDPRALAARLAALRPLHADPFVTEEWAVVSGVARALSLAPRRPDPDDADQGHASARGCERAPRVRRRTPPST